MSAAKNYHIVLTTRPGADSEPVDDNFRQDECDYPQDPQENEILIRTCYLSVDPALRCMMNEDTGVHYMSPWQVGQRIGGFGGLGIIIKSNHPDYQPGDLIETSMGWPWALYFKHTILQQNETFNKVDLGIFGEKPSLVLGNLVGVTALIGLWEKGHVTPGTNQTLVVSGAAGATGSLAGQIGRLLGCSKVVGICGTEDKCKWIRNELGFAGAINYKSEDVSVRLTELCPQGIDVYFDNVGGDISDAVIQQMNPKSHVVLCGQISQYNKDVPYPPPLPDVTTETLKNKQITRERFLVLNYPHRFEEASKQFTQWIKKGDIKYRETVFEGLENTGKAFVSMMKGGNIGKQIIYVSQTTL